MSSREEVEAHPESDQGILRVANLQGFLEEAPCLRIGSGEILGLHLGHWNQLQSSEHLIELTQFRSLGGVWKTLSSLPLT